MKAYFIVHIRMKDEVIYQKYLEQCDEILKKYHGKYLAVDEGFDVMEGINQSSRIVIIMFTSKENFKNGIIRKIISKLSTID